MKFCPNCGESLDDDARFCPECGASVPAAETVPAPAAEPEAPAEEVLNPEEAPAESKPEKKKKSKAGLIIGIIALLLIAAAAAIYFSGVWKNFLPASRLKLGLAESALVDSRLDEVFAESATRNAIRDTKAAVEITCDLESNGGIFDEITYYKMIIDEMVLHADIDVSDAAKNFCLQLLYKGNPALDASVFYNDDQLGIYIPQLDKNYYTIPAEKLSELVAEEGEAVSVKPDLSPFDEAKTRKEVMDLLKILAKLSTKENTEIEKKYPAHLFDRKSPNEVERYAITPTQEQYKLVIDSIADYLAKDSSYLGGRFENFYQLVRAGSSSDTEVFQDGVWTETHTDLPETLPELLHQHAEEWAKELADKHTVIEVLLLNNTVVSHRITNDDVKLIIDSERKDETGHVFVSATIDEETAIGDIVFDRNKPEASTYNLRITVPGEERIVINASGEFNETKRSAIGTNPGTMTLWVNGAELFNVTIKENGEAMDHIIKITPPEESESDLLSVTVNAKVTEGSGVSEPAGVSPTDLSGKSAEEIGEIFSDMIEQLYGVLINTFMGSMF